MASTPPKIDKELRLASFLGKMAMRHLHGGGYAMGVPETTVMPIRPFFKARRCIVVAPAYRRSMVEPYPAAIDDCYTAALWLRDNLEKLGASNKEMIVGGHSGGGGLTAALSLRARDRMAEDGLKIAFQMPIYPMIDDRMQTPSSIGNTAAFWNSRSNRLAWDLYLADLYKEGCAIPHDAAPSRATDYSGLPPTLTFVGGLEPFCDETLEYVRQLKAAGVPVKFAYYPGAFHGFESVAPNAAISRAADAFLREGFAEGIDGNFDSWNSEIPVITDQ